MHPSREVGAPMSLQHQNEIPITKSYREIRCSCNRNLQPKVYGIPIAKSYREFRCHNDSSHRRTYHNPQPRAALRGLRLSHRIQRQCRGACGAGRHSCVSRPGSTCLAARTRDVERLRSHLSRLAVPWSLRFAATRSRSTVMLSWRSTVLRRSGGTSRAKSSM